MAARLKAHKTDTGGKVELLLVRPVGDCWLALARPAQRLRAGSELTLDTGDWQLTVEEVLGNGRVRLGFEQTRKRGLSVAEVLDQAGEVPLPPYIRREPDGKDRQRYQTVFARRLGAVAAPTAGLHFHGAAYPRHPGSRSGGRSHSPARRTGYVRARPL